MKGDFTRDSFQPQKHFSSVRSQQGRVPLDAEFNEAQDIANYLDEATRQDTIGLCGVPQNGGGFRLSLLEDNGFQDIALSTGRIYVDGILAVNEPGREVDVTYIDPTTLKVASNRLEGEDLAKGQWVEVWSEDHKPQTLQIIQVTSNGDSTWHLTVTSSPSLSSSSGYRLRRLRTLLTQPDLPDSKLPEKNGYYLAYLDVWSRHITALEDSTLQEIALGGPDTATRLKTIAQVKLREVTDHTAPITFKPGWSPVDNIQPARLRSRAQPESLAARPALVPARAGYRRQENQLYRVEIHRGGKVTEATFKWSRDNGTLLTGWSGSDTLTDTLTVDSLGPDSMRRFRSNQWVEISDDTRDLHNSPGKLLQLTNAIDQTLTLSVKVRRSDFPRLPKVRGWDHTATHFEDDHGVTVNPHLEDGAVKVLEGCWIMLEDGVQIFFEKGGTYNSGDYWLIPARVINGDVIWPRDDSGQPLAEPPLGIKHHYCPLGLLQRKNNKWEQEIIDYRRQFLPLTDLINIQSCGEIVVRPSDNLQEIFDRIPAKDSAKLCFHPGIWNLSTTVPGDNKGSLILVGAGEATQLVGSNIDRVLQFTNCKNITVENITVKGGNKGEVGNGLQGSLSFKECENITLDKAQITCASYNSRRISAIEVQAADEITICNSYIQVGHRQIGLLLINGKRITVNNNAITVDKSYKPNLLEDPQVAIALGHHLIGKIEESEENTVDPEENTVDPEENTVDPEENTGRIEKIGLDNKNRLLIRFSSQNPKSLVFTTDPQININDWTQLLNSERILPANKNDLSPKKAKIRLRKLRSHLTRQVLDQLDQLDSSRILPESIRKLGKDLLDKLSKTKGQATGSQGIVIAGNRTPSFGSQNPDGNNLLIVHGELAPNATIANNQITGFAEGIHVGTSDNTSKIFRSYHLQITNNTIQLHAPLLAAERHGIFVGHAHTVKILDNLIHLIWPKPDQQPDPPPTDGIRLYGVYGPLLQIRQNHCIGVTLGISIKAIKAINAYEHDKRIVLAWKVEENAYAGPGEAEGENNDLLNS